MDLMVVILVDRVVPQDQLQLASESGGMNQILAGASRPLR